MKKFSGTPPYLDSNHPVDTSCRLLPCRPPVAPFPQTQRGVRLPRLSRSVNGLPCSLDWKVVTNGCSWLDLGKTCSFIIGANELRMAMSQEPSRDVSEDLVQMNFFILGGFPLGGGIFLL